MKKYIDAEKLIAEIDSMLSACTKQTHTGVYNTCHRIKGIIASLQQEQPIEGKQVVIITETDGDANIHWDCRSLDDVKALLASAQSFITDKQVEELRGAGSGPDYNTTEGRFRNAHKFQQEQPAESDVIKGGDFISDGKRVFLVLANVKERNLGETGSTFCEGHILGVDGVVYCNGDNFKKFKRATLNERAKFIHDLKVGVELKEQPEVDLEKEVTHFVDDDKILSKFVKYDDALLIARHFYELGLNARKV